MDDQFFRDHFKKFLQQNSEENRGLLEKSSNPETSTVGVLIHKAILCMKMMI